MPVPWMERTGRTPGGVIGAWFNVVVCGALLVGVPIAVWTKADGDAAKVLFALGAVVVAGSMEVTFVRTLRQQIARRRGE